MLFFVVQAMNFKNIADQRIVMYLIVSLFISAFRLDKKFNETEPKLS